jgi:hypothetical protein
VPAVKAEFALQRWQEGDPDGDIFLNGSSVSGLTQSEQDALNSAYQSGFFVSLISPETQEMNDLLVVLGLQPLILENDPVDLYAVSREFNVSGVRHYTMDSMDLEGQVSPIELSFQRERVELLITWAINQQDQTQLATSVRETGAAPNQLTELADSVSHTQTWSFPAGLTILPPPFIGDPKPSLSDLKGNFQFTLRAWSVHSESDNLDYYFFEAVPQFTPNTTLRKSSSVSARVLPCSPPLLVLHPPIAPNDINPNSNTNPKHFIKQSRDFLIPTPF